MKFRVQMKDPDVLIDATKEAAERSISDIRTKLDENEKKELIEARAAGFLEIAQTWFTYGECLTVEIDTVEKSIRVCTTKELRS